MSDYKEACATLTPLRSAWLLAFLTLAGMPSLALVAGGGNVSQEEIVTFERARLEAFAKADKATFE